VEYSKIRDQKLALSNGVKVSDEDQYTPKLVRFTGEKKEGLCQHCHPHRWYKLKTSHYWYHLQFVHGIDQRTKKPFPRPCRVKGRQGQCPNCKLWLQVGENGVPAFFWFKHLQTCR